MTDEYLDVPGHLHQAPIINDRHLFDVPPWLLTPDGRRIALTLWEPCAAVDDAVRVKIEGFIQVPRAWLNEVNDAP